MTVVILCKSDPTYLLLLLLIEAFVDFLFSLRLPYEFRRAK